MRLQGVREGKRLITTGLECQIWWDEMVEVCMGAICSSQKKMVPVEVVRGRSSNFVKDEDERSCANSGSSCCAAAMAVKSIEADV